MQKVGLKMDLKWILGLNLGPICGLCQSLAAEATRLYSAMTSKYSVSG